MHIYLFFLLLARGVWGKVAELVGRREEGSWRVGEGNTQREWGVKQNNLATKKLPGRITRSGTSRNGRFGI